LKPETPLHTPVALIGAGPVGLEVAWALKRAGLDYLHFDKNQIASTIARFPEGMTFFSSTDRIAIAGVPLQTENQAKATKEQYLNYLRTVALTFDLKVRTYQEVTAIQRVGDHFWLTSRTAAGDHRYTADRVILATGDMAFPRKLGVPGEDLPHVSHYFRSTHPYFRQRVLVVGGKNSAVETALRCYHAGAHVTLSYRGPAFNDKSVKYWLLPELLGRVKHGEITCHFNTTPTEITSTHVTLSSSAPTPNPQPPTPPLLIPADFVLLLTGYTADTRLAEMAGVELHGDSRTPRYNPHTMETNVPRLFVAGTAVAGTQHSYQVFIENCHVHAQRIVAALTGAPPPDAPAPPASPES
jgi:thioredoxin reductase (NADPH)